MAFNLSNNPGGTNGSTVTTADLTSGDKWDAAIPGTGGTDIWDNTHLIHGTNSIKIATSATSTSTYNGWTSTSIGAAVPLMAGRFYLFMPSNPAANFNVVRGLSGGAQAFRVSVSTAGKLFISDSTNAVTLASGSITAGSFVRVEFVYNVGASATGTISYFNSPESTTPTETFSVATGNFGTTNFDEIRFGVGATAASVAAYWFSAINANSTGMPGPLITQSWEPSMRVRRQVFGPTMQRHQYRRRQTQKPLVQQGPFHTTRNRLPVERRFRGRVSEPPLPQIILAPVYPVQDTRKVRRLFGRLRGRAVNPVPPQVFQGPGYPPVDSRGRFRQVLAHVRGRSVMPTPPQVFQGPPYPTYDAHRLRQVLGRVRGRSVTVPAAQTAPAPVITRRSRFGFSRRGRAVTPVLTQTVPVPPAYPIAAVHRLRAVLGRVRGRTATPVPPQQVVTPLVYPVAAVHRLRIVLGRVRGRSTTPVQAQVILAPAYPVAPSHRLRQALGQFRRRTATPVPAQTTPPADIHRVHQALARTHGRPSMSSPPQLTPPQPVHQPVRRPLWRRGRTAATASTQPVPLVPRPLARKVKPPRAAVPRHRETPGPAQVNLFGPVVPKFVHRLRQVLGRVRGHSATPVRPGLPTTTSIFVVGRPGVTWYAGDPTVGWSADDPGITWYAGDPNPGWSSGTPVNTWIAGRPQMPSGGISALSTQYIPVPVTDLVEGLPADPTGFAVSMAFVLGRFSPQPSDWVDAVWQTSTVNGQYNAQALVGPEGSKTLTAGVWTVWVKISADPETPIIQSGWLTVY